MYTQLPYTYTRIYAYTHRHIPICVYANAYVRVHAYAGGGGGGLRSPEPEKIAIKLRSMAVNCNKIAGEIAVIFLWSQNSMPAMSRSGEEICSQLHTRR